MAKADTSIVQKIRQFAESPDRVRLRGQATSDIMAWNLTKLGVCEKIVEWIDDGEETKEIVLHSGPMKGQKAYVLKPRICNTLFYIKASFCELGGTDEEMLLISVHPDH